MKPTQRWWLGLGLLSSLWGTPDFSLQLARAAEPAEVLPRRQTKPPGPALSPADAIAKMTVPPGFQVELVASEPDIVNPVAMAIDERGRFWITESFEYPRTSPGPGKDRIKVLEDTDGDGKAEKVTIFAEGLNIPSGIAVGHGGVWVANAPDILFLQDTDGDGKADKQEVVVTGFGRHDTHELPNSLTWGPDGWLYGLNGVFNRSIVKQNGKTFDFTVALFRIHPKTREFQLFCEGTSNPWGVAWDESGSAFISACVIDHMWHLTETGYYIRQGGPYPPFTWRIDSIVKHKHQLAAYCGLTYFDSPAYPAAYRNKLYMGNIHGGCLNVDSLRKTGSTYFASGEPDFLTANDAWFMPVVQKVGPDGSIYVLDWYDRYHCYQDANRDPAGIDRLKGRLYRIRYEQTPRRFGFDLAKLTTPELIKLLTSENIYDRETAQRLLVERNDPNAVAGLQQAVLDEKATFKSRMHALWTLVGTGKLDPAFHLQLLQNNNVSVRAWGVRAAGNFKDLTPAVQTAVLALKADPSPEVLLQVAIAAPKLLGAKSMPVLVEVLSNSGQDILLPKIVWQNLHPQLEAHSEEFLTLLNESDWRSKAPLAALMPRIVERILGRKQDAPAAAAQLFALMANGKYPAPAVAKQILSILAEKIQSRELAGDKLEQLREKLSPAIAAVLKGETSGPLYLDAALLATTWKDPSALAAVRQVFQEPQQPAARRLQALDALIAAGDIEVLNAVSAVLATPQASPSEFRGTILAALGRSSAEQVATVVLDNYKHFEPDLQPRAVELLAQRVVWAKPLLVAIGKNQVPASVLNVNQVRRLLASKDPELVAAVKARWGSLRAERNPQREEVITQMRKLLRQTPGDAHRGLVVFNRVCAQCHQIYGAGHNVGPEITRNGRGSFEQLLSNVFDPSLVIGAAYQARTVITQDGRVLTGLLAEDNDQRVVLKMQGGKQETVARDDVDEVVVSELSLMPEGVEKQMQPQEIADLFAFLCLDKPPTDPSARSLPGSGVIEPRATTDAAQFDELLAQLAPGFSTQAVGEGGLAIVADHAGRPGVLRTHPVDRNTPCVIKAQVDVPKDKKTKLLLAVSHAPEGDWQLVVKANGKKLHDSIIGPKTVQEGWQEVSIDLTGFAGEKVQLEILNQANNWAYEFGYWGRLEVVSE